MIGLAGLFSLIEESWQIFHEFSGIVDRYGTAEQAAESPGCTRSALLNIPPGMPASACVVRVPLNLQLLALPRDDRGEKSRLFILERMGVFQEGFGVVHPPAMDDRGRRRFFRRVVKWRYFVINRQLSTSCSESYSVFVGMNRHPGKDHRVTTCLQLFDHLSSCLYTA